MPQEFFERIFMDALEIVEIFLKKVDIQERYKQHNGGSVKILSLIKMPNHLGVICHGSGGLRRYIYCQDFPQELELAARMMSRESTRVGQWVEFLTDNMNTIIAIRSVDMVYPTLPTQGEGIAVLCHLCHLFISLNRTDDVYEAKAIGRVYDPNIRVSDAYRYGGVPFLATIVYKRQAGQGFWEVDFVQ